MTTSCFKGNFTQQPAIPPEGIEAALNVLRSGRLHRYNTTTPSELSETALLEQEYAAWQDTDYCLACASGGQAMQIALRAAGVNPGDLVMTNAFTLAPVPGAITAVGGKVVLIEITPNLVIDIDDLVNKTKSSGAQYLMLSHMRGHLADMHKMTAVTQSLGITLLEDCAHTMGADWGNTKSGNFGLAACFSTQTYKHINAGEGGLLTSNDPRFMARAVILSGSYMLYGRHGTVPAANYFNDAKLDMPNMSARMDNLRAAILRPQLAQLSDNIEAWNKRYNEVAAHLSSCQYIQLPTRLPLEKFVGSSIQFRVSNIDTTTATTLLTRLAKRGVDLKWFGSAKPLGFTSTHHSWRYLPPMTLPQTDALLSSLFDMRLPLTFSLADCALIGRIINEEITHCQANYS